MSWSLSDSLKKKLANHDPVVALESAVITHGLPKPLNFQCAKDLEEVVRSKGAHPATIGLIEGEVRVGLSEEEIQTLAKASSPIKVGLHNLPMGVAQRGSGGTTVATTVYMAWKAGIPVMATGGIGGVHRGKPLDISGDLPLLARAEVMVVCSGAKIILDLPATREWLETWGIGVVGYRCSDFPGFYTESTGLGVDYSAEKIDQILEIWHQKKRLGLPGSLLIVQPPPRSLDRRDVERMIDAALKEARQENITGGSITPFLLSRLSDLSQGKTLSINVDLLKENARLAAEIVCGLS